MFTKILILLLQIKMAENVGLFHNLHFDIDIVFMQGFYGNKMSEMTLFKLFLHSTLGEIPKPCGRKSDLRTLGHWRLESSPFSFPFLLLLFLPPRKSALPVKKNNEGASSPSSSCPVAMETDVKCISLITYSAGMRGRKKKRNHAT